MSKYTTEVRFICETASGLGESKGYVDVDTIITNAIPKIFNFTFPIFDENYRLVLEKKILKHFYTREICEETVGLWKLRLDTKLNEIMPYYNKLYNSELFEFNPLYTANLTRTKKTEYDSNRDTSNNVNGSATGSNTNTGTDLYSDTPQGSLTGVESETYLTNARKTLDAANSTATSTNSSTGTDALNSTEDYLETVIGFEGSNASDLLMKYRETFLNIDMMVIEDLETLFFQLW